MEQKKTMKLWQMIVLAVLLAAVTISMFFPVLNPTGEKIVSSFEGFFQKYEDDEDKDLSEKCKSMLKAIEEDDGRKDMEDDCDNCLDTLDKNDYLVFPASGLEFLNKNFVLDNSLDAVDNYKDDEADDFKKAEKEGEEYVNYNKAIISIYDTYTTFRVVAGIMYFVPLILLILTIFAFCFKWNKYMMGIINAIAAAIGTGVFAVIHFMTPSFISTEGKAAANIVAKFGVNVSSDVFDDFSSELLSTLWKAMRGNGFIITAIIFLLVLVMAIVAMATGGSEVEADEGVGPIGVIPGGIGGQGGFSGGPGGFPGGQGGFPGGQGGFPGGQGGFPDGPGEFPGGSGRVPGGQPTPPTPPTPPVVKQPPVQNLGRVRCIQGNSNVPGYKFPEQNKIIVGANPSKCQIVINGAPHVSNIHCSIRYRSQTNTYIVKDHSSNGTFVNGARLPKDQAMEYPAGTVLSLADGSNKIRLGD